MAANGFDWLGKNCIDSHLIGLGEMSKKQYYLTQQRILELIGLGLSWRQELVDELVDELGRRAGSTNFFGVENNAENNAT